MAEFAKIEGLDAVVRGLRALPEEFGSKGGGPIRVALAKGTLVIRDDAEERAPVRTGNLRAQVYMYRDRNPRASGATERYIIAVRSKQGARTYRIRTRGKFAGRTRRVYANDAFYWVFVEFGTENMPAEPFMRPAYESKKHQAVSTVVSTMGRSVKNATARARRKAGIVR